MLISGFVCLVILIFGGVVDIGVLATVLGGFRPLVDGCYTAVACGT